MSRAGRAGGAGASSTAPAGIAAAVAAASARSPIALSVQWYPSVASTMDTAREAADGGAAEGLAIIADEQTAGRGRRGRSWSSPPGAGLYLSFVLRPPQTMIGRPLSLLTLAVGVAVQAAVVRASGVAADLKWPNDLLYGGQKLGGILAEGAGLATPASAVVVGVGVNLGIAAHPPDVDERATSLEAALGAAPDRARVLEELLVAIPSTYVSLRSGGADDILRAWRSVAPSAVAARVEWNEPAGVRRGVTEGVDDQGALLIRRDDGGVERVIAAELRWL